MRSALALSGFLATALALIAGPAWAQNLPWCATLETDENRNCAYYTEQQCREEISGIGGMCSPNPSASPPTLTPTAPPADATLGPPLDVDPVPPPELGGPINPGPPPY